MWRWARAREAPPRTPGDGRKRTSTASPARPMAETLPILLSCGMAGSVPYGTIWPGDTGEGATAAAAGATAGIADPDMPNVDVPKGDADDAAVVKRPPPLTPPPGMLKREGDPAAPPTPLWGPNMPPLVVPPNSDPPEAWVLNSELGAGPELKSPPLAG